MDIFSVITLFGGLALFLFGMTVMGDSLEKQGGSKLKRILERLTSSKLGGVLLGAGVTAIIQSSSATTVMVVGFVNSGIMKLSQSISVIMGANIGTTVTAWLISLTGIQSDSLIMRFLKPSCFSFVLAFIGILLYMFYGKTGKKDIGAACLGFTVLIVGMDYMSAAVKPLADVPEFRNILLLFNNPVLGVLTGALLTGIIQSSSASVGILQALSVTGSIHYSNAIPIILGQNIGTCITPILASIGASKNAKRTAAVHLSFNIIGTCVFLIVIYTIQSFSPFSFWELPIDKGGIANFHTLFNLTCTVLFLPFTGLLVKLARWSVPTGETQEDPLAKLEPRFLTTPALALDQAQRCIADMGEAAKSNFHLAIDPMFGGSAASEEIFREHEAFLDRAEVEIGRYLTTMHNVRSVDQRRQSAEMMHSLSDFEKIGDYAQNIFDRADEFRQAGLSFSATAMNELHAMTDAVSEVLDMTVEAYVTQSVSLARSVEPLEEVVDTMKEQLKSRHIERLGEGGCTMQTGIHFLDIVHDLEKISDHCSNIAIYTIQLVEGAEEFDTHAYAKAEFKSGPQFESKLKFYQSKYLSRLNDVAQA